ncbi:MAG: chitobiase/beta-hexosaminidase C-terminal domain-containing protein [Ruminiclostridium sp.]|nr:chitobiase/beta-hexosaminidase C-terminal domain-containing protein [Ruminiclostridium sp.]
MTRFAKRCGSLLLALIFSVFAAAVLLPVKADAGTVIKYELTYPKNAVTLTFTPQSSGNTIYFATNGNTPTKKSRQYSKPLTAKQKTTVRAVEYNTSGKKVASFKMVIMPKANNPEISTEIRNDKIYVTLKSEYSSAKIYYTTDGSVPNESSTLYKSSFVCDSGTVVKARTFVENMRASNAAALKVKKTADIADDGIENQMLNYVNSYRHSYGRENLKLSPKLCEAAQIRVNELTTLLTHTRPDGRGCFTVLSDLEISYSVAAENLACGQATIEAVMKEWMASRSHNENMLAKRFNKIGVACAKIHGVMYWVQIFTN